MLTTVDHFRARTEQLVPVNILSGRSRLILLGLLLVNSAVVIARGEEEYTLDERNHWSLQPLNEIEPPKLVDHQLAEWARGEIDRFVAHKFNAAGLAPARDADGRRMIRRVYFDLTGLPPSPAEIVKFEEDPDPRAYEALVDRLLASPRYGERWGQHWLDVVRFAETEGFEYDRHRPDAWRYRDWVIRAFNEDLPYDQFVRLQIAGDELSEASALSEAAGLSEEAELSEAAGLSEAAELSEAAGFDADALVAAGFLRLGAIRRNAGNPKVALSRNEVLTEMTDNIGTIFLGMTVGCARCHDHEFDPIRQKDYYHLQAFLAATQEHDVPLVSPKEQLAWQQRTDLIQKEIDLLKSKTERATADELKSLEAAIKATKAKLPGPHPSIFSVQNDAARRTQIHVLKRGEWAKKLDPVGPRTLGVLLPSGTPQLTADVDRPRTRLAQWITHPDNPLTARVMVNRIWHYHFGQGLVTTANDFGVNGHPPHNPQLLDWLANRFVKTGWSVKAMHRLILTSRTYRQSTRPADPAAARQQDPENEFLSHFSRRRLSAEEIRDSMLTAAGRLNLESGGPSVMIPVEQDLINLLYKPDQWQVTAKVREHERRAVYLIAKRNLRLPFMEVFDQPDRQTSCARRESSTHAPQALELLNGTFSNGLAERFAARLARQAGEDPAEQVTLAFQLACGRAPTSRERELALEFLKNELPKEFALAVFNLNSFLYVD